MKYIKPINEWKSPAYTRGEVTIFTKRSSDVDFDFAQKIAKLLGYEVKEQVYDNAYVVLCEPGKEEQCGSAFVEDYPEFFESYEREDVRSTKLTDIGDDIKERVQDLMDDTPEGQDQNQQ